MRLMSLSIALFGFWLLLSGHYTVFLVAVGALCCIGTVALARRMGIVDAEGHPVQLLGRALVYWVWLLKEMVTSAVRVARIIVNPALPISPTILKVSSTQKTDAGVTTYANSITLTPGTISLDVDGRDIYVHAIERAGADALGNGEMDRKVTWMEGAR